MVVHNIANEEEFKAVLAANHEVVVVDAYATWCGPCKLIAPKVVEFSEREDLGKAHYVKVDVDDVPEVAAALSVRAMPTFFVFKKATEKQLAEKLKINSTDTSKMSSEPVVVVGANKQALETAIVDALKPKKDE